MQPDRTPTEWQQPSAQPTGAPFAAPVNNPPEEPVRQPIVTLTPDDSSTDLVQPPSVSQADEVDESIELLHWQAKEYIQRDKSPIWFVSFVLVFLVMMAISIFLIKSWTFSVLVPIMAVSLLMYVYRPPRTLNYTLSGKGVYVNDQLYPFADFKAFGVIKDDDELLIMLVPSKRFKPGVTVFFPEEVGEPLVDIIGARLPMRELKLDLVDRLIRKLRI